MLPEQLALATALRPQAAPPALVSAHLLFPATTSHVGLVGQRRVAGHVELHALSATTRPRRRHVTYRSIDSLINRHSANGTNDGYKSMLIVFLSAQLNTKAEVLKFCFMYGTGLRSSATTAHLIQNVAPT